MLGAVLGPLGDFTHVLSNTLSYPPGYGYYWMGMPFWTPLLFGSATGLIGSVHLVASARKDPPGSLAHAIAALFGFLAVYGLSGFLPKETWLTDLCLGTLALLYAQLIAPGWKNIRAGILIGLAGTCLEVALVQGGAFHYEPGNTALLGVPSWLPWLYFSASAAIEPWTRLFTAATPNPRFSESP